jgi:hypothetical protein
VQGKFHPIAAGWLWQLNVDRMHTHHRCTADVNRTKSVACQAVLVIVAVLAFISP